MRVAVKRPKVRAYQPGGDFDARKLVREPGEAPAAPRLRLRLSLCCSCCACNKPQSTLEAQGFHRAHQRAAARENIKGAAIVSIFDP